MAKKSAGGKVSSSLKGTEAVDEFLRKLDHPLKPVLAALRKTILDAHSEIGEGIKWNAPSFYFKEYFATAGIRSEDFVRVIFHKGAKVKDLSSEGMQVSDLTGLLEWLGKERCTVKLYDMKDFKKKQAALRDIVNQWIKQM